MIAPTNVFTYELTNDTFTVTAAMGIRSLSVYCSTATSGTVTGGATLDGKPSSAITISQGLSYNNTVTNSSVFDGLVITAPAGCTLIINANI